MYHPLSKFFQHVSKGDDLLTCVEEVFFNSVPKAREEVWSEAIYYGEAIYIQIREGLPYLDD